MRLNKLKLGGIYAPNNLLLAPLAGYTNAVFRQICTELGAGLTFTEMVSAKGLCYNSQATAQLLKLPPYYTGIKACQLFGSEPEYVQRAASSEYLKDYEIIDINMGCPVPKIFKNGEGSALMQDFSLASKIIKAAKTSGKVVTVKFRIGLTGDKLIAADFAEMCEQSGADMITIHGRTRDKIYSGEVNFAQIAEAKKRVKIPVIANGGVFCKEDCDRLINETGADGVMVARGAMFKPWIFAEICGKSYNKRQIVERQIEQTLNEYGERFATVYMRKMIAFYIKGTRGNAEIKKRLFAANSVAEVKEIALALSWD